MFASLHLLIVLEIRFLYFLPFWPTFSTTSTRYGEVSPEFRHVNQFIHSFLEDGVVMGRGIPW